MPRLLFHHFVSILRRKVLYLYCFYNLLGGWGTRAYKTLSRTQKGKIPDRQMVSNKTQPGEWVGGLPGKNKNWVQSQLYLGSSPSSLTGYVHGVGKSLCFFVLQFSICKI